MTDDELLAAIRTRGSAGRWTDQPPSQAKPPAAATREAVHAAELTLGHPLPPLLRRLYTEIADGGVGPFCGIQGVTPDTWSTLDDYLAYLAVETEPGVPPPPPRGVFLLCDFGCATGTLIDCREDQGRMWWWDQGDRYKLQLTFPEWIQAWLEGRVDDAMTGAARIDDEESWTWPDDW